MTVAVRGRVPRDPKGKFTEQIATHIQERLQALERAIAGGSPTFIAGTTPTFGSGTLPSGGSGGGGGGGGGGTVGVTDHGALTGLADDDHPQYSQRGEPIPPHSHGPFDVHGLEERFVRRFERVLPAHTHAADDIVGLDRQQQRQVPHSHVVGDVVDLRSDDTQFVLAARVFGG